MKDESFEFIKGPNNKVSVVGFGSYGEVKLAKNLETEEVVAIKMINGKNAKDEIDVHHKLDHPNIIKLLNYYYDDEKNMTYMVLQFAEGGTLNQKIKFGFGHLPKDKVKKYFRDICRAVDYLHSLKYMHRDIKPENILLTKDGHAKLCDFGFAAMLEYRNTRCGTYEYMAPEMIQEKPYDYKVDVWALGILLFELIQGVAPFRGQSGQDVIGEMKKQIAFSNRFQKQEIELIRMILRVNSEKRPKVSQILQHSFFKGIDNQQNNSPQSPSSPKQTKKLFKFKSPITNQIPRTGSNLTGLKKQLFQKEEKTEEKIQKKFMPPPPTPQCTDKEKQKQFKPFIPQAKQNYLQNKQNYVGMTSPTSVTTSQFQNYTLSSPYSANSTAGTLPGLQTALNSTTSPITSGNSVASSMGGTSNTSPLTAYTLKSPVNQGQTSSYTFLNKNPVTKPSVTGVFSPSSLNRNNIPTTSTQGSNYTGIQTSYNTNSGATNPPQTNFWRKN